MKERMLGAPRSNVERAATHFRIGVEQVTEAHIRALPTRGTGLEIGTATEMNPSSIFVASTGASIGALIGGPIGAAIGAVIGVRLGGRL